MTTRRASLRGGLADSRGFTLPEVLVVVAVTALAIGMVGSLVFQSLSLQQSWQRDVEATRAWRHAGSWFATDALNAQGTNLMDGAPSAASVTMSWADSGGLPHAVTYSLANGDLVRSFDGVQTVVARRVAFAGFSLAGKVLTFSLAVEAERQGTETASLQTYLRSFK